MARYEPAEVAREKVEPLQILRGFREWAIGAIGYLLQQAIKIGEYCLIALVLSVLLVIVVAGFALVPVACVVAIVVLGVSIIVSMIVDAIIDLLNSIVTAIRNARTESKRKEAILKQA